MHIQFVVFLETQKVAAEKLCVYLDAARTNISNSQSKTHETQIIKYGKCGKIENQRVLDHSQIKRSKSKRENHIYNECLTFDGTSFISTAVSNVKIFETKPNRRETCETENKTENKMQTVQSCRNRLIDVTIGFDKFFICFYAYSFCVCFVLIPELCTVT